MTRKKLYAGISIALITVAGLLSAKATRRQSITGTFFYYISPYYHIALTSTDYTMFTTSTEEYPASIKSYRLYAFQDDHYVPLYIQGPTY